MLPYLPPKIGQTKCPHIKETGPLPVRHNGGLIRSYIVTEVQPLGSITSVVQRFPRFFLTWNVLPFMEEKSIHVKINSGLKIPYIRKKACPHFYRLCGYLNRTIYSAIFSLHSHFHFNDLVSPVKRVTLTISKRASFTIAMNEQMGEIFYPELLNIFKSDTPPLHDLILKLWHNELNIWRSSINEFYLHMLSSAMVRLIKPEKMINNVKNMQICCKSNDRKMSRTMLCLVESGEKKNTHQSALEVASVLFYLSSLMPYLFNWWIKTWKIREP